MAKRLSFLHFLAAAGVFYAVAVLCLSFGFDIARANLLTATAIVLWVNVNGVSKRGLEVLGLLGGIFYLLTFFIDAHIWGVWLFALFLLAFGGLGADFSKEAVGKLMVFAAAFFNLSFVTNTGIGDVQYDFASCYNYVEYILENDFLFWRENPLLERPSYSSYHPILHFFLAAGYLWTGMFFGLSKQAASEAAQVMFCFYMFGYYLISARIFNRFGLKRTAYLAGLSLVCFFPAYNAVAGFFNNDGLLLALQAGTLFYALCYYQDGERKNLCLMALCATGAALTKLSGVLVLPAAGYLLLMRLWRERDRQTFYEIVLCGLGIICGVMIWPLYQHYFFGISFDYVPAQPHLGLAGYGLWQRFDPIKAFVYQDMYYHNFGVNLWETMSKTALFLQWDFSLRAADIAGLILVMSFLYKVILGLVGVFFVYLAFRGEDKKMFLFLAVLILSLLGGEVMFVLKHPFMCNQDFRYVALLPLGWGLILAKGAEKLDIQRSAAGLILAFCLCCTVVWWRVSF